MARHKPRDKKGPQNKTKIALTLDSAMTLVSYISVTPAPSAGQDLPHSVRENLRCPWWYLPPHGGYSINTPQLLLYLTHPSIVGRKQLDLIGGLERSSCARIAEPRFSSSSLEISLPQVRVLFRSLPLWEGPAPMAVACRAPAQPVRSEWSLPQFQVLYSEAQLPADISHIRQYQLYWK